MTRRKKASGQKPPKNQCLLDGIDWCTHVHCREPFDEWAFDEFSTQYVGALEERRAELEEEVRQLRARMDKAN